MSLESLTLPHLLAWRPAASPACCWRGQLLPVTLRPVVPEQDRERASHPEEQAAHLQQPSASTSWGRGVPCGPLSYRRRGERPLLLGLYPRLRQGTEVAVLQGLKQRAHVPGQRQLDPHPRCLPCRKASRCQQPGRLGWFFLHLGVLSPGEGPRPLLAVTLGWQGQEPLGCLSRLGLSALAHAVPAPGTAQPPQLHVVR